MLAAASDDGGLKGQGRCGMRKKKKTADIVTACRAAGWSVTAWMCQSGFSGPQHEYDQWSGRMRADLIDSSFFDCK